MAPFTITEDTPLLPPQAWARVTDWPRHGAHVPLTTVAVSPPGPSGVGTLVTARTGVGRAGFDDPMEILEWAPPADGSPGRCRLEKRGKAIRGWAEITVEARDGGSRVTWREDASPTHLPRFAEPLSARSGRFLFGRVLRKLLAD